jgi:hypothetical protein
MDVTVELPPDPQRVITGMRVMYRRGRLVAQSFGVVVVVLGAAILAGVFLADGDGFDLLLGALMVILGVVAYRRYDRAIAGIVARRPAYAQVGCTARLDDDGLSVTYPQASLHFAWPAISKVVNTHGLWLFYSGWPVVLALPVASLGPAETEELTALVAERGLGGHV